MDQTESRFLPPEDEILKSLEGEQKADKFLPAQLIGRNALKFLKWPFAKFMNHKYMGAMVTTVLLTGSVSTFGDYKIHNWVHQSKIELGKEGGQAFADAATEGIDKYVNGGRFSNAVTNQVAKTTAKSAPTFVQKLAVEMVLNSPEATWYMEVRAKQDINHDGYLGDPSLHIKSKNSVGIEAIAAPPKP